MSVPGSSVAVRITDISNDVGKYRYQQCREEQNSTQGHEELEPFVLHPEIETVGTDEQSKELLGKFTVTENDG